MIAFINEGLGHGIAFSPFSAGQDAFSVRFLEQAARGSRIDKAGTKAGPDDGTIAPELAGIPIHQDRVGARHVGLLVFTERR
jgi:hypothetical protein